MTALADEIDALAMGFSGVVSVSRGDEVEFERAYGLADRAHGIAATPDTQFGIASGTKGFTASTIAYLITEGVLSMTTTARSVLGTDLPLISADVTVEHLLGHRSGIGDYIDEDSPDELPLKVPVQRLLTTADYLPALDGFPTKFAADTEFSYCNSGFVLLALIAERVTGLPFHDLVAERVFAPAGMSDTGFPRSDELPARAATGYLDDGRTNVFHLPIRGNGDGGAYTTVADVRSFWLALLAGQLVAPEWVTRLTSPRSDVPKEGKRYGLGFWLHATGSTVLLEGYDYGVSFRTAHDPESGLTWTVVGNTSGGAWPIARRLPELLS